MICLQDYIKEYIVEREVYKAKNKWTYGLQRGDTYPDEYLKDILEFFNGDVPKHYITALKNKQYGDYIFDNLQSHDYRLLLKKIKELFSEYILDCDVIYSNYKDDKAAAIGLEVTDLSITKTNEFKNLINFFNYFIRNIKLDKKIVLIEPAYSEKANEYVYNKCKGQLYHFTAKDNRDSILRNGLKIKRKSYQLYPERIYCFAGDKLNLYKYDKSYLNNFIKTVIDSQKSINDFIVFKINLHKDLHCDLDFYKDTAMPYKEAIFTYNNIPAYYLTEIKLKDF